MSYYDFDNHFWSPKQVCCQSKVQKKKREINPIITPKTLFFGTLALVCVAISTTALINYQATVNSDIQEENTESACIVLSRETFRMYCSLSK
ncbi:hypothetical protein BLD44_010010 [Mastigocladus laminosus UU774]|nr:hypothetical protein B4U84_20435 [Westiellopsis prolifica IICB1]TFI54582.1 hypothetical protein BLD44_010010 [Mastigocladus laminosus UU774]